MMFPDVALLHTGTMTCTDVSRCTLLYTGTMTCTDVSRCTLLHTGTIIMYMVFQDVALLHTGSYTCNDFFQMLHCYILVLLHVLVFPDVHCYILGTITCSTGVSRCTRATYWYYYMQCFQMYIVPVCSTGAYILETYCTMYIVLMSRCSTVHLELHWCFSTCT